MDSKISSVFFLADFWIKVLQWLSSKTFEVRTYFIISEADLPKGSVKTLANPIFETVIQFW
jgi:hypothetical protein